MMPSRDAFRFVSIVAYVDASNLGYADASAIEDGDTFMGAWPAAEARGFLRNNDRHSGLRGMYTGGYLLGLERRFPHGVECDRKNRVMNAPVRPEGF